MGSLEWVEADALAWLPLKRGQLGAIACSPPDMGDFKPALEPAEYHEWLARALMRCFRAASPGRPSIFYFTDRIQGGRWHSKPGLAARIAAGAKQRLLWHKIVLRREPGAIDLYRPGYGHLLAFGDRRCKPGARSADVLPRSPALYANGTPAAAVQAAVRFAALSGESLCDPFCGRGAIPIAAAALGMQALGCDNSAEQLAHCRANAEAAQLVA